MRTAETMDAARTQLGKSFERIRAILPEGDIREEFDRHASDILENARLATEAQARLERTPGAIEGDRFVEPQPATNLSSLITHGRKGLEIHYSRHDAETSAYQTLAFIDKGKTLDVRDWSNSESVNAALQLASQKWDSLRINGSDAYKETVAQLAAQHGYKITNPEIQKSHPRDSGGERGATSNPERGCRRAANERHRISPSRQPLLDGRRAQTT